MQQYKVLKQKGKWFSGKFDPQRLEEAINSYAKQGWSVKTAFSAFTLFGEEAVIILERDV